MSKRLPSIVLFIIAGALLIYTASQTLDLLKLFLPVEQAPLAYLALVAFDGGLLGWSYFFAKGARGSWQRSIAAIMIVVSIVAVVIGFAGETFFNASKKGLLTITPDMSATVVWAVCAVIAANVVAIVVTHLSSPEHRKAMAEEEANDVIEDAVIEAIKKCAPMTARQIAPHKVTEWVEQQVQFHLPPTTNGRVVDALPAPQQQPVALAQTATLPDDSESLMQKFADKVKQVFIRSSMQAPVQPPVPTQPPAAPQQPAPMTRTRPIANTRSEPYAVRDRRKKRMERLHQKPLTPAQEDMKQKIVQSVQPTNPQTALPTNQANGQSRKVKQLPPMKY